ncbi:phosphoenolpyruvate-dependent sugar phosphotransferase system eiia 2 [Lucifera butyrica]|uniref:Phosphoenolpyruvate-dependent sugar phosphotransferase system eiia 2 n=1 Tax=Lucifera butyrica TaxID=1351585 RepID=A0A498R8H3_9FIRM|nr:BglG family transcription antiterminator [Lucifera butyrica]VBB07230.1 phosphoenolpyruvate-dependent sugar phosphotransferase system eiia 2 [Lucifera butyrica]
MKGNYRKLIKTLLDNDDWTTASSLASTLNVSERSIKTYIAEINGNENGLIASSRKGYLIDREKAKNLSDESGGNLPRTVKERVNYIITNILTKDALGNRKTDLYQLAEEIFVSVETIKKDMVKVKKKLREFDLYIAAANSYVTIEGSELDKRKILSNILYEEFNKNVMSFEVIETVFPGYDLKLLQSIITEQCKQYHYYINEYALLNLVLDIIIGIDRIKKERTFGQSRIEGKRFGIREQELARDIAAKIEENFHISYSPAEQEELTIILLSHLMKMDFAALNNENIKAIVGEDCLQIIDAVRSLLKSTYFIDADNQDFIAKFTLHIKNLLVRLENGYTTKNPLLDHIKNTCPLIFECAVEVANKIREITNYDLKEDEMAYIALHIGSNLENQKSKRKIISCIILFPQYYDFSNIMTEKLKQRFGERIEIKTVVTSLEQISETEKVDLLISTIPVAETIQREWVRITPFVNDRDFENIEDKIQKISLRKKREKLKQQLMQISNPKFFYKNVDFKNKEEAIRFMTDVMEKEGYVTGSFYSEIFHRENQASTAFEHIAVPHSMEMNAKKTGMFVLLNEKKPIEWDHHSVSIVFLFAINRIERAIFHDVYDNLIVLLLEKNNAAQVTGCNNYIDFIEAVVGCFH